MDYGIEVMCCLGNPSDDLSDLFLQGLHLLKHEPGIKKKNNNNNCFACALQVLTYMEHQKKYYTTNELDPMKWSILLPRCDKK